MIALVVAAEAPLYAQAAPATPSSSASTASSPPPAPVPPAPATQPAPPPPVPVPFQLVGDKIVVPATIDGAGPFSLGIDSGAETVMFTQHVADEAKVPVKTGTVALSGATGNYMPVPQAMVDTVQVGNAVVKKPFCTISPEHLSIDGYIGAPLFNFYVVQIDFGNRTITCYPPASFKPDPADIAIPIILGKQRVPVVKGQIAGVPASCEIDTGSEFPAELSPQFVKKYDLASKFTKLGTTESFSIGGPVESAVYAVPGVVLGTPEAPLNWPQALPTLFLNPAVPVIGDFDGRIGAPALMGLVVTFDYIHSMLYVRPSVPSAASSPQAASPQTPPPAPPASPSANSPGAAP